MKDTKKVISEHYSKMSKKRHEVNPPSKDHMRMMQKKSVESRLRKKDEKTKTKNKEQETEA